MKLVKDIDGRNTSQRISRDVYAALMLYQELRFKEDGKIFVSFSDLVAELLRENQALRQLK